MNIHCHELDGEWGLSTSIQLGFLECFPDTPCNNNTALWKNILL